MEGFTQLSVSAVQAGDSVATYSGRTTNPTIRRVYRTSTHDDGTTTLTFVDGYSERLPSTSVVNVPIRGRDRPRRRGFRD